MNTRIAYLVTGTLLLGACSLSEDSLDDFEPTVEAEFTNPNDTDFTSADSANGLAAPDAGAETYSNINGLDECHEMRAPIIARVDHTAIPDCAFSEMPQDWEAKSLVSASPWVIEALNTMPLPETSPLLDFCKYEYLGDDDLTAAYTLFFEAATDTPFVDRESMATDCPVVIPQGGLGGPGGLDGPGMIAATHGAFLDSVDALDSVALENLHGTKSHLYLLDTAQQDEPALEPHSDMLRELVTDLVCVHNPSACDDIIHQILVTPRNEAEGAFVTDWYGGGTNGYLHELNLGIVVAVQDWQARNDDSNSQTLERGIINLSVGAADQGLYATDPGYAPMQAVIEAARMASCFGLPIYAAAGNSNAVERYCPGVTDGLMFPASLENEDAPQQAECVDWGYIPNWDTNTFPISYANEGLTIAVAGVDHFDEPIANHRGNSRTRHAAPAASGVSSTGLTPMTGTSVASAVYAATNQVMWAVSPESSPLVVGNAIYASGWDLGVVANAGRHVGNQTRRLSMCASVNELAGGLGCAASPPNPTALDGIVAATQLAVNQAGQALPFSNHDLVTEFQSPAAAMACIPQSDSKLAAPLPEKPICGNCTAGHFAATDQSGDDALFMTITTQSHFEDLTVINAYLHVSDTSGLLETITLSPSVVTSINNANASVVIEVNFQQPTMAFAELEFIYQNSFGRKFSHSNSLLVW